MSRLSIPRPRSQVAQSHRSSGLPREVASNCGDPAAPPATSPDFRSAAEYPEPTGWVRWRCRRYQPATLAETCKLESAAGLLAVSPAVASDLVVGVVTGLEPEHQTHLSP